MGRFAIRVAVSIAVLGIAIVAMVAAAALFVYAFYLFLAMYVGAPAAAALTGITILIGAAVLVALAGAAFRPRRRRDKNPTLEGYETAAEAGNLLGRKVRGLLNAHSHGGLVAMFIAGFSIGVSPGLRRTLRELLKW